MFEDYATFAWTKTYDVDIFKTSAIAQDRIQIVRKGNHKLFIFMSFHKQRKNKLFQI